MRNFVSRPRLSSPPQTVAPRPLSSVKLAAPAFGDPAAELERARRFGHSLESLQSRPDSPEPSLPAPVVQRVITASGKTLGAADLAANKTYQSASLLQQRVMEGLLGVAEPFNLTQAKEAAKNPPKDLLPLYSLKE